MKGRTSFFSHYMGFVIAIFALAGLIMATAKYIAVMPAAAYDDCGVMEFTAAEWYTKTEYVRRMGSTPAHTNYNYYVRYAASDSGGADYSYHERVSSVEEARAAVNARAEIERRVLSDGDGYRTIPAKQTKGQWLKKARVTCFTVFFCSAAYLACFVAFAIKRRLRSHPPSGRED